ncbi:MAG: hypothetical protein ACREP9_10955, partial [Candidatus Dormibacteraceae bacterium]
SLENISISRYFQGIRLMVASSSRDSSHGSSMVANRLNVEGEPSITTVTVYCGHSNQYPPGSHLVLLGRQYAVYLQSEPYPG